MDVDALELVCLVIGGAVIISGVWHWMKHRLDEEERRWQTRQDVHHAIKQRREAEQRNRSRTPGRGI